MHWWLELWRSWREYVLFGTSRSAQGKAPWWAAYNRTTPTMKTLTYHNLKDSKQFPEKPWNKW